MMIPRQFNMLLKERAARRGQWWSKWITRNQG